MSIILTEVRRERVAVVERRGTIVEEAGKTDENAQADAATPRSTAPRSMIVGCCDCEMDLSTRAE